MLFGKISIRSRMTLIFVSILGVTLLLFSALLYRVFMGNRRMEFDAALFNHAVDVAQGIKLNAYGGITVNPDILSAGEKVFPFSLDRAFLQILTPDGSVLARSLTLENSRLPFYASDSQALLQRGSVFRVVSAQDIFPNSGQKKVSYRLITYLVREQSASRYIVQLAVPITILSKESEGLLGFFMLAIPLILVVATLVGLYFSRRALAPLGLIIDKTNNMTANKLSERLPIPVANDELRQLTLTLNGLLNRLQLAFQSQERFVADASHQLKTPLAILRGELDVIRSRPRSEEEVGEFLGSAAQELNHLSKMVEDLLLLARVDAGESCLATQDVRMDEVAVESVSRLESFARARDVRVRLDLVESGVKAADTLDGNGEFEVKGDPDLLRSMLHNLLENAIKFSPDSSCVEVRVEDSADSVKLSVLDHGPGIPEEGHEKIFERFYRAGSQPKVSGTGLGLPIARRIAEAHNGSIDAQSLESGGALFNVRIKKL